MEFSSVDQFLWLCGFGCNVGLLCVLVFRSRCRVFPIFTLLITFQILSSVVLFYLFRYVGDGAYQRTDSIITTIDYMFQIALVIEIAFQVLRPNGVWIRNSRPMMFGAASFFFVLAVLLTIVIKPPNVSLAELRDIRIELLTSLLTCGIYLCLLRVANRFGLLWRSHVFSLGQGVAIWAAMACIGDVAHIATGWRCEFESFEHLRIIVYLGTLIFWTYKFSSTERGIPLAPANVHQILEDIAGRSHRKEN